MFKRSKERNMNVNFEIVKDFFSFDKFGEKERHEGTVTGVSSDDQYRLAGRSYRALGPGREKGLFTNSNATEADRLSRKYVSYEGDSVEGSAKKAFIEDDVVRWKSNGRIPFGDMLLDFYHLGYISKDQMIKSAILHEKGNSEFWSNVTTESFKCEETGEDMIRFIPGKDAFKEEAKYTNQRSVA